MYLPRTLISHLYLQLVKSHHALSPPVLILVALEPDALCACRIFTALLKRDYIPHTIKPIAGYGDLTTAGKELVQPMRLSDGGSGGVVCCLGVGGLVDLEAILGLEMNEDGSGGSDGVDVWIMDSRRPWNLSNVFGGQPQHDTPNAVAAPAGRGVDQGQISRTYRTGKGGIIVFDDGDIQTDLSAQREAWFALEEMPQVDDEGDYSDAEESNDDEDGPLREASPNRKRKSPADEDDTEVESDKENARPRQRRRSNSSSSIPSSDNTPSKSRGSDPILTSTPPSNQLSSPPAVPQSPKQPSARQLRRRLLRMRRKHEAAIRSYHSLGTCYAEPVSSLMYSLVSELGREDNDFLWLAIVGLSSTELYGRTSTGVSLAPQDQPTAASGWQRSRGSRIRQVMRDEVRRLNPPELTETGREVLRGHAADTIPVYARSPTDTAIRLSPEPRFLLIRHWSLYDSMLHSPYLSAKLHIWSDVGRRRLHKLLAKMGVSLSQCRQSYTHMDMELKKVLRERLLHFAPMYGLEGLIPPAGGGRAAEQEGWGFVRSWGWKACLSAADVAIIVGAILEVGHRRDASSKNAGASSVQADSSASAESALSRFYDAYDALLSPTRLSSAIPFAQTLHRAILQTGTLLLQKKQIRHLRAFRMALVKEGPDVGLFCTSGALTKLALWVGEAIAEVEPEHRGEATGKRKAGTPLVLGCLDEARGVYVVVGLGGSGGASVASAEAQKAKKEQKEDKAKEKETKKEAKRRERERQRLEHELDDDYEEEETEEEDDSSDDEDSSDEDDDGSGERNMFRNRFGNAFQEVVQETNARVRLDSFEHCVVEVKKEDLGGFLESLSMKAVVG